jgi:hypothetical protein
MQRDGYGWRRQLVTTIKVSLYAVDDDLGGRIGIYEKVQDSSVQVYENR